MNLSQPQQARLSKLLHMEYTLRELATELNCSVDQLKHTCELDCPHRVDSRERVWIIGDEFSRWYATRKAQRKIKLKPDEAYCLRCRAAVPLHVEQVISGKHGTRREVGTCPICNATVNRIRRRPAS